MKRTNFALAALTTLLPSVALAGVSAFDVAEDLSRFVYDEAPVFEDKMPAYRNAFVTQGYVYPSDTLDGARSVAKVE